MSNGSVNDIILVDKILNEIRLNQDKQGKLQFFTTSLKRLKQEFPELSDDELEKLLHIIILANKKEASEEPELVITAPPSFRLSAKLTENIVLDMINSAKSSILLTGYSVSDYINGILDLIIEKSKKGVFIKIFLNNVDKQEYVKKLLVYKGNFLKIYNYVNKDDSMSALHAKIISIDGNDNLISSANLSYHGMSGNIEVGSRIRSTKISKQIDNIFKQLIFQRVFKEI